MHQSISFCALLNLDYIQNIRILHSRINIYIYIYKYFPHYVMQYLLNEDKYRKLHTLSKGKLEICRINIFSYSNVNNFKHSGTFRSAIFAFVGVIHRTFYTHVIMMIFTTFKKTGRKMMLNQLSKLQLVVLSVWFKLIGISPWTNVCIEVRISYHYKDLNREYVNLNMLGISACMIVFLLSK